MVPSEIFILTSTIFPHLGFKFQEVLLFVISQLSDEPVGDWFGEVVVIEGVGVPVVHEEERTVRGIHKLKVAPIRPFELLEVDLDPFNLLFRKGGVVTVGVVR